MQDFIQFTLTHWFLIGIFVALLLLLLIEEARSKGLMHQLTPSGAVQMINRDQAVVIDLRDPVAFSEGHIVDAVNLPLKDLEKDLSKLDKYRDSPLILVCTTGQKGGELIRKIHSKKIEKVYVLTGGINGWRNAQMPLVKK